MSRPSKDQDTEPAMSSGDSAGEGFDPQLVYDLAIRHPDVTTAHALGLNRLERAEPLGLVPLGLPLPQGKRDLLVPAESVLQVRLEISGQVDQAVRRDSLLAQGRRALAGLPVSLTADRDRLRLRAVMTGELVWPNLAGPLRLDVSRGMDAMEIAGQDDDELALRLIADPALSRDHEAALSRVAAWLRKRGEELESHGDGDGWGFANLALRLVRSARNRYDADELLVRWDADLDQWRRERAEARGRLHVDRHFDFARFERLFPVARGLNRRLVLIVGPTNSGKTHRAIEALKAARDGIYLAPLRLLALEVMERLNREGTPASLITGEEVIETPGARHSAATIETMDPDRPVEVGVIDEIQMLADPDRGWAWTAALIGAPAETLYILGAPEALPMVRRVAERLGEELEVIELDRKVPLTLIDRRLEWEEVEPGDALIAFSRREVHAIRDTVKARGLTVATVYGALAPDVRRREAARFVSGAADVVVATDAIGMGLNLPCRRVLFTALEKFDGQAVRALTPTEVKQIAGRAGRYGHFEEGMFGVVGRGSPQALRKMLEKGDPRLMPQAPLPVRPSRAMLLRLARHIDSEDIGLLISCFADAKTDGSPYRMDDLAVLRQVARLIGERRLSLSARLDFTLCPADVREEGDLRALTAMLDAVEKGNPLPLGLLVPPRLDGMDAPTLEAMSRACDLYGWAARKFPALFPDRVLVRGRRDAIGQLLSALLASGARTRRVEPPKAGFRGATRKRFGPRRR